MMTMMKSVVDDKMTVMPNKKHVATGMEIQRSVAQQQDDEHYTNLHLSETLAKAETRSVSILRVAVISTLLLTAGIVSTGVYLYTRNEERHNFTSHFEDSAHQIVESFHDMVERNLGAVGSLSTDFTSYALQSNATFPFVTLPDFALRGSHFRTQSGSHIVHWMPLVTDDNRVAWETYANVTRDHIDEEFEQDTMYRMKQDAELLGHEVVEEEEEQQDENDGGEHRGLLLEDEVEWHRLLEEEGTTPPPAAERPMSVVQDGTGYHDRIWSNGALVPAGDEPVGSGPYLPTWQRSPISGQRQAFLNMNWVNAKVIGPGLLDVMLKEKKAVLRNAAVPIPKMLQMLHANLAISQYRENVQDYIDGLSTFLVYPVFDNFSENKKVAGVLATNVYWKILLSHLLPSSSRGILCVVENSFQQTFTYRVDGPTATFLGLGDAHDPKYDELELSENINAYLERRASPKTRAYNTVPVSDSSQYTIRVYPSQDTEDEFVTNEPIIYTIVVIFGFALASFLFLVFSYVVEKRQHIMIAKVVENAERVTATERELNEFLAHEVRNPLSAAISASAFVTSALYDETGEGLSDPETRRFVQEDMEVVNSSLNFINDFLRSMLDIHRANGNKIRIQKAPTDILRDILEPVSAILHKRVATYEVQVECPENLIVQTDCIRLKQVILNLVRNSSEFVERGFVRMKANVVDHQVRLYVEDSGPGIPPEKRKELFAKYQLSLDLLSQGTGLGLNLSKKLMQSMDGDIWLDESFDSGIDGCPGACFVVQLNATPLDIEATLLTDSESDNPNSTTTMTLPAATDALGDNPSSTKDTGVHDNNNNNIPPPSLFSIPPTPEESAASAPLFPSAAPPATAPLFSAPSAPLFAATPPAPLFAAATAPPAAGVPLFATAANPPNGSTGVTPPPPPPAPAPKPPAPSGTPLPTDVSVLFVDDDAVLRKLFVRAVKKVAPSWNIKEASSGEMALKLCEEQEFTLIFLDQYMASVDKQLLGTETAQAMRSKGVKSTICGLSANDIRDSFISSGANDFLLKPMPCKGDSLKEALFRILKSGGDDR